MNSMVWLFGCGVLQVALVSLNTYQVAHRKFLAALPVGFLISWVWAHNVHGVAFGSEWDRIAYALGAAVGTVLGMWVGRMLHGNKRGKR